MRAGEVVDAFRDLHTRVTTDRRFAGVINASAARDMHWADEGLASKLLSRSEVECFQVARNMVPVVQMAAESLDTSDTFRLDFAPAREGFVQFETPLTVRDIRERTMNISWVRWGVAQPGMFWAVAFSDTSHPDEVSFDSQVPGIELTAVLGRWRYTGTSAIRDGERLTLMDAETRAYIRWTKDADPASDPPPVRPVTISGGGSNDQQLPRLLKALWLLMVQEVGVASSQSLDRAAAKRAKRLRLPTQVTVIELRRPRTNGAGEGPGREFSVRWLVKGHFAWRACSKEHALAEPYEKGWRARVWISSYAKNAERDDLPWASGPKIYQLVR